MTTPLDAYRPPVVVTDHAWWGVRNPEDSYAVTYWRDLNAATEHADRCYYRYGRRPFPFGVAELPR